MKGDKDVKFADFVSGDTGMTMMVLLVSGSKSNLKVPIITFQKDRRSHSIQSVPDNVLSVCYNSEPRAGIDAGVFREWRGEKCVMVATSRRENTGFVCR